MNKTKTINEKMSRREKITKRIIKHSKGIFKGSKEEFNRFEDIIRRILEYHIPHKSETLIDVWESLLWNMAKEILVSFKRSYGFRIISRETNNEIDLASDFGRNVFLGAMTTFIENAIHRVLEGEDK